MLDWTHPLIEGFRQRPKAGAGGLGRDPLSRAERRSSDWWRNTTDDVGTLLTNKDYLCSQELPPDNSSWPRSGFGQHL